MCEVRDKTTSGAAGNMDMDAENGGGGAFLATTSGETASMDMEERQ